MNESESNKACYQLLYSCLLWRDNVSILRSLAFTQDRVTKMSKNPPKLELLLLMLTLKGIDEENVCDRHL